MYEMMKVFTLPRDCPRDVWEEICEEQPNDSYRCIWMDHDYMPLTVKYLLDNGATLEDKRVLVSISW
jgi:hypothetical protein